MFTHEDLRSLSRDQLRTLARNRAISICPDGTPLTSAQKDSIIHALIEHKGNTDPVSSALASAITEYPGFWAKIDKHLEDNKPIQIVLPELDSAGKPVTIGDTIPNDPVMKRMAMYAAAGIDFGLKGPAGCGKSTLVRLIAKALGYRFGMISCSGGVQEFHFTGRILPDATGAWTFRSTPFLDFFETPVTPECGWNGSIFLLDEMDAIGDPQVLMALNAPFDDNREFFIPAREGSPHIKRADRTCFVFASNTDLTGADPTYIARTALDGSSADRFAGRIIQVDYNAEYEEKVAATHPKGPILLKWIQMVRETIKANALRRIMSTRALKHGIQDMELGMSAKEVANNLIASWTEEERTMLKGRIE